MATHQATTSNAKRQRGDDKDQQHDKIQRLESPDESMQTKKIVDLNDYSLVNIFNHLDLQSLFNVAITSEWFGPAARDVYKRKFGEKSVKICKCDDFILKTGANAGNHHYTMLVELREFDFSIKVSGLKTSLQYLRCFGASIDELKVNYNTSKSKRYGRVHQYINDYCAENLKDISFEQMPNITINQFQSVFANVNRINFGSSDFGKQLPSIIKCFTNVHHLAFDNTHIALGKLAPRSIAEPFQHLKKLNFYGSNGFVSNKDATALLQLVKRPLQKLYFRVRGDQMTMNVFLDMIKENSSITELSVPRYKVMSVNLKEIRRLAKEHPTLVKLNLKDFLFTAKNAIELMQQINSLEEFGFKIHRSEYAKLKAALQKSELTMAHEWRQNFNSAGHTSVTFNRSKK